MKLMILFCSVSTTLFVETLSWTCIMGISHFRRDSPQYSVGIVEYFVLKFVVKRLHLVNSRNL